MQDRFAQSQLEWRPRLVVCDWPKLLVSQCTKREMDAALTDPAPSGVDSRLSSPSRLSCIINNRRIIGTLLQLTTGPLVLLWGPSASPCVISAIMLHTHTHAYTRMLTYTNPHTRTYAHLHTQTHTQIYTQAHLHTSTSTPHIRPHLIHISLN